jgi:hypothetical protein
MSTRYWLLAWAFSIGFGEIILPAVFNPGYALFRDHWLAISLYYGAVSAGFAWLFPRSTWLGLAAAFVFGGLVETLVFKGIPNFIAAGLVYVGLFGIPWAIVAKSRGL